jgi:hypothetical protein
MSQFVNPNTASIATRDTLCAICGHPLGRHEGAGEFCPVFMVAVPPQDTSVTHSPLIPYVNSPQELDTAIRQFASGATRNVDHHKLDYEGFLSPMVLHRFAVYMDKHRQQADGSLRSSDNWQKGIPKDVYIKSLIRHTIDFWAVTRGIGVVDHDTGEQATDEDLACAILFNAMGWLYETLTHKTEGDTK